MRRRVADRAFWLVTFLCVAVACALFAAIAGVLLWRGLPGLAGWLSGLAGDDGTPLGFQLLGSLLLIATALLASLPVAIALALTRSYYVGNPRVRKWFSLSLQTLNGVPSIVFGIFGLAFFIGFLGWGKSWLAGGLILGLMILPTLTLALAERIDAIPRPYLSAAMALGLGPGQIVRAVVLPQSASGLVSGALLGMARAAGETAPILFVAAVFSGVTWPRGITDSPVLALPYHIFVRAQDSLVPGAQAELWAAALLLLLLVTGLSALTVPLRWRLHREAERVGG